MLTADRQRAGCVSYLSYAADCGVVCGCLVIEVQWPTCHPSHVHRHTSQVDCATEWQARVASLCSSPDGADDTPRCLTADSSCHRNEATRWSSPDTRLFCFIRVSVPDGCRAVVDLLVQQGALKLDEAVCGRCHIDLSLVGLRVPFLLSTMHSDCRCGTSSSSVAQTLLITCCVLQVR